MNESQERTQLQIRINSTRRRSCRSLSQRNEIDIPIRDKDEVDGWMDGRRNDRKRMWKEIAYLDLRVQSQTQLRSPYFLTDIKPKSSERNQINIENLDESTIYQHKSKTEQRTLPFSFSFRSTLLNGNSQVPTIGILVVKLPQRRALQRRMLELRSGGCSRERQRPVIHRTRRRLCAFIRRTRGGLHGRSFR